MAPVRTPRSRWIEAGFLALAGGGPDAVRIESLAKGLGVTKGGFYGYFEDRQALLDEMLDTWEATMTDQVIERIDAGGREGLRQLFAISTSSEVGELLEVEMAVREWARHDGGVAARLERVDDRRMDFMRALFADFCPDPEEVEARCMIVISLFVAAKLISTRHGPRGRPEVLRRILERLEE